MKRFFVFVGLMLLMGLSELMAQSPDDQYVRIYDAIQEGDSLYTRELFTQALAKYVDALTALQKFQKGYPEWNAAVVKFRLSYLSAKVAELSSKVPESPAPTPTVPVTRAPAASATAPPPDWEAQLAGAKGRIQQLLSEKALLEAKLKEALSAQPATVDARELAKAEEKLRVLQKENELLNVTLQQKGKAAPALTPAESAKPDKTIVELNRQLAEQKDIVSRLTLEKETLQNRLKELPTGGGPDTTTVATLRARLEALEAQAVPYTPEELALFKPSSAKVSMGVPAKKPSGKLSRASAASLAEAQRLVAAGQFDKAEERYLQVVKDDDQNVPLLANLAEIQVQLGKLDEAEKNITRALDLAPNDPQSLSTLGNLKSHQRRYDEAVDALSRAAKLEPTSPEIQNRLGISLSQKGLRGPAETALRKALLLRPAFGDAHKNLAIIYLSQDPPLTELARWHYQKALAAGSPPNPELEKMLQAKKTAEDKNW